MTNPALKKLAVVTGSQGGLGQSLCTVLAKEWLVVGLDKKSSQHPWRTFACDLTEPELVHATLAQIEAEFGTPDLLVNNAGVYLAKTWDAIGLDEFDLTLSINLRTPFLLSRLTAQKMIAAGKGGTIINISSVAGQVGSVDPSYAVSKAGLDMLTKCLGKALAPFDIRVLAVSPGPVKTKMAEAIPEDRKRHYMETIPMKRFAEPDEIARVVKFLASPNAEYMTGTVVTVDGGLV